MRPIYIFDLDGTLALIEHRRHFVEGEKKDWRAFYAHCIFDLPNIPILEILNRLVRTDCDIRIFSGRSDEVRRETEEWLYRNTELSTVEITSCLTMREAGDCTDDDLLKMRWLGMMELHERARIVCTFDDRDRVVKMWRNNGITCCQVATGDF